MKISLKHRITAALMAILMLITSSGLSMDVHFCRGEFINFSFFGEAEPCEMALKQEEKTPVKEETHSCCHAKKAEKVEVETCSHTSEIKGNCCHNESFSIDTSDAYEVEQFTLDFTNLIVEIPQIYTVELAFNSFKSELNYFHYYHPPPISRDIQALHQVFII
ncbi:HYC_CC_PP family protein [Parvicella tangerina]|uniref:Secreted protein n=1 Tax=Parvicella tangerina TaxID=2829795 RepID=A0A916JM18_9FLAO|nr:hypothetical protein [Parvicella tangerina]CAG5082077.1 hypothetical protein CRYO30217_01801 [Parvicella tangerina]